jgi:serine/threonine-protein kinase HipA
MAQQLGLDVPVHSVRRFNDLLALQITRFDRGPGTLGQVWHCVSAGTALGLTQLADREDPRRSHVALRSRLLHPGDALELFRRIVLNAMVGNTDDHPWNTSLRQLGLNDWRLSPLYDVMPYFNRHGPIVFSMAILRDNSRSGDDESLVKAGLQLAKLPPDAARAEIDRIRAHVRAHWRETFERHAAEVDLPIALVQEWARVFEMRSPL